ncbi:MAG: hypothetical protein MJY82_10195 [Fibrobacter sp.]|nr:hypothetical protein [Fibrobacter sp.]
MRNCFYSIILLLLFAVAAQAELTPGADGCYAIASKEDFASFMNNHSSECGKLTADIELGSWTPAASFSGTLDGQGHSITWLNVSVNGNNLAALFATAGGSSSKPAVIKNVSLLKASITTNVGTVASFVAEVTGNLVIDNCYSKASVNRKGNGNDNPAAIFVARVASGASLTVVNSYSDGSVSNKSTKAGFVGENNGSVTIENCVDNGLGFVGGGSGTTNTTHNYTITSSTSESEKAQIFADLQSYSNESTGVKGSSWVLDESGNRVPTVVLQWTAPSQNFAVNELGGSIVIADGQSLYANGVIYSGTLSDAQKKAIGANTLRPVSGVTLDGGVATLDGSSQTSVVIPEGFTSESVALIREFKDNVYSTIVLPFSATISNASLLKFKGVHKKDGVWTASVVAVSNNLEANTPYMLLPSSSAMDFSNVAWSSNADVSAESDSAQWIFKGTYDYVKWEPEELGNIFGFAASSKNGSYKAGQFVRAASGASINPMRAFLVYKPVTARPGVNGSRMSIAPADLPESIDVVIEEEDGSSMRIGQLNTLSGEISVDHAIAKDRWFSVDGRKLNAKPTAKGTYYNNGKRVIVK